MSMQINLRMSEDFLEKAKIYAKNHGFLNVQEFIRDAAREKIYNNLEIKQSYLERLNTKEATSFLSDSESKDFEKQLEKRAMVE
ncbi:hypothetical protein HOD20_02390 [archaeon]|jgi:hypothetical protein|nr:hypothetical protein [archaeon]MBT4351356.1 hypothetical protein [archaeon]MBT4648504.1 hypothetical protein [archaeon]MBT6820837.1 hypothetical protein [archaeon]MBT7391304.1 hypothetical protein [archaeon]